MNFDKVAILLRIVHDSIGVPNTDKIRQAAIDELKTINEAKPDGESTYIADTDDTSSARRR